MNPVEITVVLKDGDRTYRHKFLIYDEVLLSPECAIIRDCIAEACKNFTGQPDDVIIKASMTL